VLIEPSAAPEYAEGAVHVWVVEVSGSRTSGSELRARSGPLPDLSTILAAAVDDRLIATNPCASGSVRPPKVVRGRVAPWTVERVRAVVAGHPDERRAAPIIGAGCGLRQGEVFGLTVDAVSQHHSHTLPSRS
jgi:hypothetical protein